MRKKRKSQNGTGRLCITFIMLVFMVVMSSQIVRVYKKDREYIAKEQSLQEQILYQQDRQNELEQYEVYTKSQQYVEDVAKSKLGLLYENEIIFKEQK